MSVKIRLRRMGERNLPFYRIVVTDSRFPSKGRFLETLGWYDPNKESGANMELNLERVAYWTEQGAQLSTTVNDIVKRARKYKDNPLVPKVKPAPVKKEEPEAAAEEETPAAETEAPAAEPEVTEPEVAKAEGTEPEAAEADNAPEEEKPEADA